MLILISPTKQMDFIGNLPEDLQEMMGPEERCTPPFSEEAAFINRTLETFSKSELESLMKISEKLGNPVFDNIQSFGQKALPSRPAIAAYNGTVFKSIDPPSLKKSDFEFAQNHLRILSGLYGILQPLDRINPYRLEMKTPLLIGKEESLTAFWKLRITDVLIEEEALSDINTPLLNLASGEYFKVIDKKRLPNPIITIAFKEQRGDKLKVVGMYAKVARGLMVREIIQHKITDPHILKKKKIGGYLYCKEKSSPLEWIFIRNISEA